MRAAQLIERLGRLLRAGDHGGGLNPAQWEALRFLARANRFSRTPAGLALYQGSTRGTASQTLIALETKGLIARTRSEADRRSVDLELTQAGRALLHGDGVHVLAQVVAASGVAEPLAEGLEATLRAAIAARGGRAFGACHTCRHFRRDQREGESAHHCALLDEPLSDADSDMICAEQASV